jgi:hypothetical protein
MANRLQITVVVLLLALAVPVAAAEVLVEAESFQDRGGWVVDQQFMDQMGSPYLLAHGLGVPVANASTEVDIPQEGRYRLWVRTQDWVPPHHPGRFKVILGGKAVEKEFGAEGEGWLWQDGGTVQLDGGKLRIELQDLTGFEGRCDAIYLTTNANPKPPEKPDAAMRAWRKKLLGLPQDPPDAGAFDLVVIGGGTAGSCSAAAAAQKGLKVALIQDRPVLGGNASPEIRVSIAGLVSGKKDAKVYEMTKRNLALMKAGLRNQKTLDVFTWTHAFAVEKEGQRIKAVIARRCLTGAELRFRAPLFVDCTGDGTIGFLADADYRIGRESKEETGEPLALPKADGAHMGMSLSSWKSTSAAAPSSFPDCPWAIRITDENYPAAVAPEGRKTDATRPSAAYGNAGGSWTWESGFFEKVPDNDERVRDRLFRGIYGVWDYQKNRAPNKARWANWRLTEVPYVGGKRESRRLLGDVILDAPTSARFTEFPDGIVSPGWNIDIHYPTEEQLKFFPGEEFRSWFWKPPPGAKGGRVGLVPFRSLYSRNVPNLMMAGRCMSTTHVAMGSTRVMGTGAKAGTVTGLAASLCKKYNCTPRELYEKHLDEFMALVTDPRIE